MRWKGQLRVRLPLVSVTLSLQRCCVQWFGASSHCTLHWSSHHVITVLEGGLSLAFATRAQGRLSTSNTAITSLTAVCNVQSGLDTLKPLYA